MISDPMKKTIERRPMLMLLPREGGGVAPDAGACTCGSTVAID